MNGSSRGWIWLYMDIIRTLELPLLATYLVQYHRLMYSGIYIRS